MRTRLAGFVFVLVFIMAMTYSGFMAWAQETTGQTAELPARPWWHCDYHADVPPWRIYVPCTAARESTATAVAIASAYQTRVVTPTVQHIATLVALGTPNAKAIATYRVPIGYERATKEALSVQCHQQFPPLTRRNRDRLNGCLNSLSSTWGRLASHSRMKVLALIRIQHTREASIIEATATLEALVPRLAAYPGTATAIATQWQGKVRLTATAMSWTATPTPTPDTRRCANTAAIPDPESTTLIKDCGTLLKAKATLAGSNYGLNWWTLRPINKWTGVAVSKYRVTGLYLYRSRLRGATLRGTIPTQLGNLSHLTYLNLNNNRLTGTIPPALGNLNNLKELYLAGNQYLTGSIPKELGNLSNLQRLHLGNNQLTGSIPPALGNLSNLQRLYLDFNQLTGSIPKELGNLSNLTELELRENQLTGSIPKELGNLSNLTRLQLSDNQLTGTIPKELGNLTKLTYLSLVDNNNLTGSIPSELANLPNLSQANLWGTKLCGIPDAWRARGVLIFIPIPPCPWRPSPTPTPTSTPPPH